MALSVKSLLCKHAALNPDRYNSGKVAVAARFGTPAPWGGLGRRIPPAHWPVSLAEKAEQPVQRETLSQKNTRRAAEEDSQDQPPTSPVPCLHTLTHTHIHPYFG